MQKIQEFILSIKNLASPLSTFFLGTALTCCATGLLGSFLAVSLVGNKVSTFETGIVLALHYLGYIFASFSSYKTINRVGHIRAFSVYLSALSALVLLHAFSPQPVFWG